MSLNSSRITLAMALFASLLVSAVCSAQAADRQRTLSLSATGTVSAKPDIANISTGVQSDAKTAREALSKNTEAMSAVIAGLKSSGIAPKDIQTSNFSVSPRYQHFKDRRPAEITGYRVSNSVRITVRDLAKLGDILDQVVTLGSNKINGVSFGVDDPADLLDEARKQAMATAITRAKLYTEASGTKLGRVLTINEQTFNRPPQPVFARAAMRAPKAESVPIEAGEQSIEVRISVSWELE